MSDKGPNQIVADGPDRILSGTTCQTARQGCDIPWSAGAARFWRMHRWLARFSFGGESVDLLGGVWRSLRHLARFTFSKAGKSGALSALRAVEGGSRHPVVGIRSMKLTNDSYVILIGTKNSPSAITAIKPGGRRCRRAAESFG